MSEVPHVVCLGGGYVAAYLAKALRRSIKRGTLRLTVVDRNNFHTFHGLVAEMLVGKLQPGQIISPARRLFLPGDFHNAEIESIDLQRQEVLTSRRLDGREYTLKYDHLVLGFGSVDNLSRYPGIAEHAFTLKVYGDCLRVRDHVRNMLEMAEIETDPVERRRLLKFAVAGGNYAGVEVATELAEFLPDMLKKVYPRIEPEDVSIDLIHSGDFLLPELHRQYPRLATYGSNFVDKLGINIHLNTRVSSATATEVRLSNDVRLQTRTLISCVGTAENPLLKFFPYERDPRGRLVTNEFLQVMGCQNIWAGGDCAAVPTRLGDNSPPLAVWAQTHGSKIGQNIARLSVGKTVRRYRFTGLGDAVSLGHRRAAGHLKGIQVTGLPAWLTWRFFCVLYLPTWERRIRAIQDWIVWPFIGRDIVSLQGEESVDLGGALYEPGQCIVQEGDVGNTLYIIRSGTVEVSKTSGDRQVVVGTLSAGSHFGEVAVFEGAPRTATVTAKTRVSVLAIRRDMAETLSEALSSFQQSVQQMPKAQAQADQE